MTDVFGALADPNRRHLLQALAREEATATQLAADLPVTRQAVAKHLALLDAAGLVTASRSIANAHETSAIPPPEAARAEAERLREKAWSL